MPDQLIKICGLSTPETVAAAVEAGASHIGFIHFEKSPRHLPLEDAVRLRRHVPEGIKLVLVTSAMQSDLLDQAITAIKPDVLQFHGDETAQWIASIKQATGIECWKSFGLRDRDTFVEARRFDDVADRLLFDAPAHTLPGGNGVTFQWDLLDNWEPFMPWALAGGLTPGNVAEAIQRTGAPLIDASSGLETAPGVKSIEKIRAFCKAALAA